MSIELECIDVVMFQKNIETNATVSVSSDVLNLSQINNKVSINRLMTAIGLQYLKTVGDKSTINRGFNYVTPNEHEFSGKLIFHIGSGIVYKEIKSYV